MTLKTSLILNKKHWRYLKVVLFLILGVYILWWITKGQNLDKLFDEFKQANYFWVFVAGILAVFSHYFRALRWKLLVKSLGYNPSTSETFRAVMSGYLANMLIPRMGEVSKCAVLSKSAKIPFNSLAGTMIAERVFDLVTLAALLFFTLMFQFGFLKDFLYDLFIGSSAENEFKVKAILLVVIGTIFLVGLLIARAIFIKLKTSKPDSFWFKVRIQLEGLLNGVKTLWRTDSKLLFLAYTFLIWFLYFAVVFVVFIAIEATSHLSVSAGITLLAIGSLGFLAPVPGGIGTYHFVTIATLTQLYLIEQEPATSYAYISHGMQMLSIIVTSAILWALLIIKNKTIVRQKALLDCD
jgi:uncharacterized protein (TIRG00374 family)